MSKYLVYLSGPITGLSYTDAAEGWRRRYADCLADSPAIGLLSPMRGCEHLHVGDEPMDALGDASDVLTSPAGITSRDRFDVGRSTIMVVNVIGAERVSIGTMIEIGWADAVRVPIILVMEPEGNIHDHAMVVHMCDYIVHSVEAAAILTRRLNLPGI